MLIKINVKHWSKSWTYTHILSILPTIYIPWCDENCQDLINWNWICIIGFRRFFLLKLCCCWVPMCCLIAHYTKKSNVKIKSIKMSKTYNTETGFSFLWRSIWRIMWAFTIHTSLPRKQHIFWKNCYLRNDVTFEIGVYFGTIVRHPKWVPILFILLI